MREYLTIGQTAKRLGLEVDTVRKLERTGRIKAARTTGGHRRFTVEEVDRYRRDAKARAINVRAPARAEQAARHGNSGRWRIESSPLDTELGLPRR